MTYSINPTPASTNPNLDIQVERVTETRRLFISDVGIFQITLPDDDPPEEETHTEFTVDVGQIRDRVTLRATIDLVPDFRLVPSAGGTNYKVPGGDNITLRRDDSAGDLRRCRDNCRYAVSKVSQLLLWAAV